MVCAYDTVTNGELLACRAPMYFVASASACNADRSPSRVSLLSVDDDGGALMDDDDDDANDDMVAEAGNVTVHSDKRTRMTASIPGSTQEARKRNDKKM